jgi:putative transposase
MPERPTLPRRARSHPAALQDALRKLEREVDPRLIIAKREGAEALRKTLPPQQRSVADLQALELVNIDGHKFDVFARFPDGRIGRPMMVAIQDVYSRKFSRGASARPKARC